MVAARVQIGLCRQIGEIVFLFSRQPVFADEPGLVPWQMLLTLVPDPLRWSVGHSLDVKQIARDLGVRYLLEGSVRKSSTNVRISAQLIDARSGGISGLRGTTSN